MKSIPKIIICCGLMLAVMQNAIAANTTAASAPPKTTAYKPVKKPTMAEVQKRLEDKGIKINKRKVLAKKKDIERKNKKGKKQKNFGA